MRVFFNRRPPSGPWGGGASFVKNMSDFLKLKGHDVVYDLNSDKLIDAIFMIDPRPSQDCYSVNEIYQYKNKYPSVKIIHRINECDQRKGTQFMDRLIMHSNQIADKTVFISEWLQQYFVEKGFSKDSSVVYNGCDSASFFKKKESKIRDPIRIVTHHWSDNWMKGFDMYTKLDEYLESNKEIQFTYVGRYYKGHTPSNTSIVSPLSGFELGEELRKHDIYLTASRFEPCGMHHVEGSACGMPVLFHTDGGGINELCKKHGEEFSSFEEMLEKILIIKNNYKKYCDMIDYDFLSSERCCSQYYQELTETMER